MPNYPAWRNRPDWELEFLEVFYDNNGKRPDAGFDVVIGNPPYEVLSELESGRDLTAFRAFIKHNSIYKPSRTGKNNLYKLFICQSLDLLACDGFLGFITPMSILGDDITAGVRKQIVRTTSFTSIEAFPHKDNPKKRVFPEAKLSTCVFTLKKSPSVQQRFRARVHPGRFIEEDSNSFSLTTNEIGLFDPENCTIVSCSQNDWDLAIKIMQSGRMTRLSTVATSYQGEINETNDRKARRISYNSNDGPEVIRGAHVCLYALREASQGTAIYVVEDRFLDRGQGSGDQKAFHHRYRRIGFQRKAPQNNFRRLIASSIPEGTFLLESVSYIPSHRCTVPLEVILGMLNSKLCDWFFRLGSTNAMVGEYQFKNLPYPVFSETATKAQSVTVTKSRDAMLRGKMDAAFALVSQMLTEPPFPVTLQSLLVAAVARIEAIENDRTHVRRIDRAALEPHARPYQDFIDRLLYAMAGISDSEARELEARLAQMM